MDKPAAKPAGPELSVIVLCYRSGRHVIPFVKKILSLLEGHVAAWELLLVGNYLPGVEDETPAIVVQLAQENPRIQAITLAKQGMMGWDVRSGLERARGDLICLIDGDEQMPPQDIIRVYQKIQSEKLDLVLPFRKKRYDGFLRTLNSRLFNLTLHLFFPGIKVRDANAKPKIFTREVYERLKLKADDWFLDTEIMIRSRKLKLRVGEIETEFQKLDFRKSFVKISTVGEFVKNILRMKVRDLFE